MARHRTIDFWKLAAIGLAIVVVTAVTTGVAVLRWSEHARQDQPSAALPAAVAELPPRAMPIADSQPADAAVSAPPKAIASACDEEASRAAGATLVTRKKMREIRQGEKYRAAYATCLRSKGWAT